ncbi:hypothetical protein COU58_00040 [Candidatus Pacearchaeota archaeon CG10_big_fil_rev_8_21_14_0_10_32_42]|nr:MAG: hypothetical protein COU58_00040 [Candidatus Pacearchaeota archaeon CG10_big_fil_rev_8_21_14_0_10_32_42]
MNKENLENLTDKAKDFVIKKGKKKSSIEGDYLTIMENIAYESKDLILEDSSIDFKKYGKTESFSIYLKEFLGKKELLFKKYGDGTIENYLSPVIIKAIEEIVYKK